MRLGSSLYHARKKSGLSQESVAEKLGGQPPDHLKMGDRGIT